MNKNTLIIAFLVITSGLAFAAEPAAKTAVQPVAQFGTSDSFGLGPILGSDIGTMNFQTDPGSHTSLIGGLTGGFLEFKLGGVVYLYTELAYVQHGFQMGTSYLFPDTSYHYDYVEVPALAKFKWGLGQKKRVHLFGIVGPSLGLRVRAQQQTGSSFTNISSTTEALNFGLDFGGGAEVWLGEKFAVTGTLRFAVGLTDIDKSSTVMKTIDFQTIFAAKFVL